MNTKELRPGLSITTFKYSDAKDNTLLPIVEEMKSYFIENFGSYNGVPFRNESPSDDIRLSNIYDNIIVQSGDNKIAFRVYESEGCFKYDPVMDLIVVNGHGRLVIVRGSDLKVFAMWTR